MELKGEKEREMEMRGEEAKEREPQERKLKIIVLCITSSYSRLPKMAVYFW